MSSPPTLNPSEGEASGLADEHQPLGWRRRIWIWLSLAGIVFFVGGRDISVGGFSWSDAPLHAMDGVFLHDLLTESPTGSLKNWGEEYFLRYPCLGIVVYYPPLFAAVEAVLFLLFGISVFVVRAAVLLFVVAAVWLIFEIGRELFSARVGLAAAILTLTTPHGMTWSRQVMLEWPATFFIVLALWAWWRYLRSSALREGVLIGLAVAGAYFTKQTAVFVLPAILLHAWLDRKLFLLRRATFWIPLLGAVVMIAAYALATAGYNHLAPKLLWGDPPLEHLTSWRNWFWYDLRLPEIIGWPMLVGLILAIGAIMAVHPHQPPATTGDEETVAVLDSEAFAQYRSWFRPFLLPLVWLLIWWLICTLMAAKEQRYFFFAVPALALIVAAGLKLLDWLDEKHSRPFGTWALATLCIGQSIVALLTPPPRLPDMQPTVRFLAARDDADLVLIDAVRDGQFVFDVRTTPSARGRLIPLRASKFLYARAARTRYAYTEFIASREALLAWLDEFGIGYVVIEDRLPDTSDLSWDPPPRHMLRETVGDRDLFAEVHRQSLAGNDPAWKDVSLVTYRYLRAKPRTRDTVTLPIPAMNRSVTLPLPPVRERKPID